MKPSYYRKSPDEYEITCFYPDELPKFVRDCLNTVYVKVDSLDWTLFVEELIRLKEQYYLSHETSVRLIVDVKDFEHSNVFISYFSSFRYGSSFIRLHWERFDNEI
jgi:hypothetical protein